MKTKFRIVLSLAATLSVHALSAQNYVTPVRSDLTPPTPESSSIVAVQTPRPDLLTGAVDIDIPLYTITSDGVSIPVSLKYHSNGIKVFDDPAPAGYGWSLQPALRATRTVLGRPDELYPNIGSDPNSFSEPEGACFMCTASSYTQSFKYTNRLDSEHDLFTFAIPGKTIHRALDMTSGNPVFVGANDMEYRVGATADLSAITVTDPRGVKYVFGECHEVYNDNGNHTAKTAWALSKIICDNGKTITLNWSTARHPFVSRSWSGGHSFMDKRDLTAWFNADYSPDDFESDNGEQGVFRRINETVDFLQLNSIVFNGGRMDFTYTQSPLGPMLTSVSVSHEAETVRSFTLSYEDSNYTLLKKIDGGPGCCYQFGYNTQYGTNPFSGWTQRHAQDWWGYFNNRPALSLTPKMRIKTYYSNTNTDGQYKAEIGDADRTVDAEAMQALMLVKVIWPTSGETTYTYEPHNFAPARMESNGEIHPDYDPLLSVGGGLRVKSVTTSTGPGDTAPVAVSYSYPLANVRAVPSAATFVEIYRARVPFPMREDYQGKITTELRQVNIMPVSDYMKYDHNALPLWYDWVEEIWAEGKVKVSHSDIIASEGYRPVAAFGSRHANHLGYAFGAAPVMTERTVYKSDGNGYSPLETTIYSYSREYGARALTNYSISRSILYLDPDDSCSPDVLDGKYPEPDNSNAKIDGAYTSHMYSILPWGLRLDGSSTTRYTDNGSFTASESYTYKALTGLVTSAASSASDGSAVTVAVSYPESGRSVVEAQMAEANCVGIPIAETRTVGFASTAVAAEYVRTASGAFRQSRTKTTFGDSGDSLFSPLCEYDASGNLVRATDADGIAVNWQWDAAGLYPTAKSQAGITTHYSFKPLVGLSQLVSPWGATSSYRYDAQGRLLSVDMAGLGRLTDFSYSFGAGANTVSKKTYMNALRSHETTETFDNLGRKVMSRDNASGVEQHFVYDAMGRCVRTSVPSAEAPASVYDYDLTFYEAAPDGLPVSSVRAGSQWQDAAKAATSQTLVNTSSGPLSCPRYTVSATGIDSHGNYAAGSLLVVQTVDENGHVARKYTDKTGLVVMTEEGDGADDMLRTRMVYDGYGRLRAVLPPNVADGSIAFTDSEFTAHCFEFRYDTLGRRVYSRNPGATAAHEWCFSPAGRTVAERTPFMNDKWFLHFYDSLGRRVYTARDNFSDAEIDAVVDNFYMASYTGCGERAGYTLTPEPDFSVTNVFTASYYDNYAFLDRLSNSSVPALSKSVPGLMTGSFEVFDIPVSGTRLGPLSTSLFTEGYKVFDYDAWGRLAASYTETEAGTLANAITYDRAGNILSSTFTLTRSSGAVHTLKETNLYDNSGRIKSSEASFGDKKASVKRTYGKNGLVASEVFENEVERHYEYDCHGWVSEIRTSIPAFQQAEIDPGSRLSKNFYSRVTRSDIILHPIDSVKHMPMIHHTESILYASGTNPRYDGTPSAHVSSLGGRYDYTFDTHDRLHLALYTPQSGANPEENFSARYVYDEVGAPIFIRRMGINNIIRDEAADTVSEIFGELDNLLLDWNDGHLEYVTTSQSGSDFYGRTGFQNSAAGTDAQFTWNAAGALVSDTSRGIANILYNFNGQPLIVKFTGNIGADYIYSSNGELRKLRTYKVNERPARKLLTILEKRLYCGPFVFENDSLTMVRFSGGYFDGSGNPCHLHTDWQGSVTMVTDKKGKILQHNGYYPYGEPWREPSGQPYLFSSKERLRQHTLTEYDFTARRYNSALLLWTTPDPLADSYPPNHPLIYCASNPLKYTDPTGLAIYNINSKGNLVSVSAYDNLDIINILDSEGNVAGKLELDTECIERYGTSSYYEDRCYGFFDYYRIRGDENAHQIFEFLFRNTNVEWSLFLTGDHKNGLGFITTSHDEDHEYGGTTLFNKQLQYNYFIREFSHSHPGDETSYFPSGIIERHGDTLYPSTKLWGDLYVATEFSRIFAKNYKSFISFYIWVNDNKITKFEYSGSSCLKDFRKAVDKCAITNNLKVSNKPFIK